MKLLLDTHTLVWWWTDDPRLPAAARAAIGESGNTILASAVSAWEMATKSRLGKWPAVDRMVAEFSDLLRRSRFAPLPISVEHARLAGSLDFAHRDPFDRMLFAQARAEDAALISGDAVFQDLGVSVVWG